MLKKFTGKSLCETLFFNKVASSRAETLQKDSSTKIFACEVGKFFGVDSI